MDKTTAIHLLQVMIDYFEAGNQHTDAVAKSIINLGLLKRLNSINLVSL